MDWIRFLEDHNVEFATSGLNVKKGNVGIKCPFCGEEDPSQHMGINLSNGYWGCWRSQDHAGRKPHKLVQALLGCSYAASVLVVAQYSRSDPTGLEDALAMLEPTSEAPAPVPGHEVPTYLPEDFIPIGWQDNQKQPSRTKHCRYLSYRGFNPGKVARRYDLRYCTTGRWKDRIIIPIYQGGILVGWTARAIAENCNSPRYLESSPDLKSTVFNYNGLKLGGSTLAICEGPFDAMKIDYYGKPMGVRAVCTFGVRMSFGQAMLLNNFCNRFKYVYVIYDRDAAASAYESTKWLTAKNVNIVHFKWLKDPGEMTAGQAAVFAAHIRNGYDQSMLENLWRGVQQNSS